MIETIFSKIIFGRRNFAILCMEKMNGVNGKLEDSSIENIFC